MECAAWSSVKIITMLGGGGRCCWTCGFSLSRRVAGGSVQSVVVRSAHLVAREEGGSALSLVLHQQAQPRFGGLQPGDEAGHDVAAALGAEQLDLLQPGPLLRCCVARAAGSGHGAAGAGAARVGTAARCGSAGASPPAQVLGEAHPDLEVGIHRPRGRLVRAGRPLVEGLTRPHR